MPPFDPKKPPAQAGAPENQPAPPTTGGVRVVVRDRPPPKPEWEPPPRERVPRVIVVPENQPVGDRDAFLAWLTKHWGRHLNGMIHGLRDITEPSKEELHQHVLFVACNAYEKAGRLDHVEAFIERVIGNEMCNRHGKGKLAIDDEADLDAKVASAPGPESAAERAEMRERVNRYVGDLPPRLQQVIEAEVLDGLTLEEIAEKLGLSFSVVQRDHELAVTMIRDLARASDEAVARRRSRSRK